ncbi:hypothetical protein L6164_029060 [Bauhinia variegata]|uniref:Uncharacterized protein n=1 Tax=Bauhinia variegata TaxID=167791 RepID=A0ACB9L820_BAUVA|nr:hypothetical protein L6164_029060 [Bauhinia variegata]
MPQQRPSWTIDPDIDGIDLEPSDFGSSLPLKKVPNGDVFEASRAGDVERLRYLLESGVNVNARDRWDSVALYYACLAGHLDAARMLLESGAICSEHTFDGDRCHYAALNLKDDFLILKYFIHSGIQSQSLFYIQGRPIEAHRIILSARSPFFKKERREGILEKELIHHKFAEYKALRDVDNSQKRFILQGLSFPEEDRLPAALHRALLLALSNSTLESSQDDGFDKLISGTSAMQIADDIDDCADVCVIVDKKFSAAIKLF